MVGSIVGGSAVENSTRRTSAPIRETAPPSLAGALRTLGLDRAPRVFTASRLAAVVDRLVTEPTLNANALRQGFSERGGPGRVLALEAGGSNALAALENARVGDNLRLSAAGLRRLADVLGQLAELRRLDLSRNDLRALPEALGGLVLLGELDLSGNRIEALPASLAGLSELRTLHLADNDLSELPNGLTALRRLRALGLGGNRIRALSPDIAALESLVGSAGPTSTGARRHRIVARSLPLDDLAGGAGSRAQDPTATGHQAGPSPRSLVLLACR